MKIKELAGKFLTEKRESLGKSQKVIASAVGVSSVFVSRIETGKKPMPKRLYEEWAKVLEFSPAVVHWVSELHHNQKIELHFDEDCNLEDVEMLSLLLIGFTFNKKTIKKTIQFLRANAHNREGKNE